MEFIIDDGEHAKVSDAELFALLLRVYVEGGFTTPEVAERVFDPVKVRERGMLFAARETQSGHLAGMVIVVPSDSAAALRAESNECEMHLLGVDERYRGHGLGPLVNKALNVADERHYAKMILWTQRPMRKAQGIYESFGFVKTGEMIRNGIEFLVYEKVLA